MTDDRLETGRIGEQLAAEHLERLGYAIVARNYRTRHGELDIVAADQRTLVFCEVKTRRAGPLGPIHGFTSDKQRRVRAMARAYLAAEGARARANVIRFDAIAIVLDHALRLVRLDHYEAAF